MVTSNSQGQPPSQQDLQSWAQQYNFTNIPALGTTAQDQDEWSDILFVYEADFYIPTVYHIGPDMTVRGADTYNSNPGSYL